MTSANSWSPEPRDRWQWTAPRPHGALGWTGYAAAALAIAWVLHQGEHVIALPGTTSVDHLHEDLRGGAVRLDAALLAELDDLFKPERIQGDRYAVASQREVDTEKYAFETV